MKFAQGIAWLLVGVFASCPKGHAVPQSSSRVNPAKATHAKRTSAKQPGPRSLVRNPYSRRAPRPGTLGLVDIDGEMFVDQAMYESLSDTMLTFMESYHPTNTVYIGLGRDPAPFVAYLQNLVGKERAFTFPASCSGCDWAGDYGVTDESIRPYMEKLLPQDLLADPNTTFVLFDQTANGRTLKQVPAYFERYFAARGAKAKLAKVAFTQFPERQAPNVHSIPVDNVVALFNRSPYEGTVSEYEAHLPGISNKQRYYTHDDSLRGFLRSRRKEFTPFKKAILQRMKADPELGSFLEKGFRKGVVLTERPDIETVDLDEEPYYYADELDLDTAIERVKEHLVGKRIDLDKHATPRVIEAELSPESRNRWTFASQLTGKARGNVRNALAGLLLSYDASPSGYVVKIRPNPGGLITSKDITLAKRPMKTPFVTERIRYFSEQYRDIEDQNNRQARNAIKAAVLEGLHTVTFEGGANQTIELVFRDAYYGTIEAEGKMDETIFRSFVVRRFGTGILNLLANQTAYQSPSVRVVLKLDSHGKIASQADIKVDVRADN